MAEREGVIKYRLHHAAGASPQHLKLPELIAWRSILHRLRLIGQTPERYDGYGYGNVSIRDGNGFIISGTQTGKPEQLGADGFCAVKGWCPDRNAISSIGPVKPSSEALTHAAVYDARPAIHCVLHIHSDDLWQAAQALNLPTTVATIPYGTPAMASAVSELVRTMGPDPEGVFAMLGHEDGVVAFGTDVDQTAQNLIGYLAKAVNY